MVKVRRKIGRGISPDEKRRRYFNGKVNPDDTTMFKEKQRTLFGRQKRLRENPTRSELRLKDLLIGLKEYFIFQKGFIKGDYYCIVDFYLPKRKLVIEVDGGYHFSDEMRKKDYARDKYLESRGFKTLHISNGAADNITKEGLKILLSKQ